MHGFLKRLSVQRLRRAVSALPRAEGAERHATLYLVVADAELAGPGTLRLAALLRERTRQGCEQYQA